MSNVLLVCEKLAAAIHAGNTDEAANLVAHLSELHLTLDINIKKDELEHSKKEQEFSVRIHVEDRLSDGCYFNLLVKSSDTIQDLKRKVMMKYNFPEEVQRWIIGKKLPDNDNKLSQCGVKGPGHTLYLYLVTARSVGLTKQDYEARRLALYQGISLPSKQNSQSGGHSPAQIESPESYWRSPLSPLENGSHNHSDTPSPVLSPSPDLGIGEVDQGNITYGPTRQTSKRSLTSGSSMLQEMLMSTNLASLPEPEIRQKPVPTESSSLLEEWESGYNSSATKILSYRTKRTPPPEVQAVGWNCPKCTFLNLPFRPGCEMCTGPRPSEYVVPLGYQMTPEECQLLENDQLLEKMTREAQENEVMANYQLLMDTDNIDLITNTVQFECPICFDDIDVGEGLVLRECLHMFCRDCLTEAVRHCDNAILKCPYQEGTYTCQSILLEREIRALVSDELYLKYLQRGLDQAESQTANSYHCKTADCPGWCIYEDLVNFFNCPVCGKENCLTCKAIHEGQNCKQYQDDLKLRATNDIAAKKTDELLQKLVADGQAMHCPQCKVVVQKKDGCDWIKCSICKTEICWVTKGARWGPLGEGDLSGGCHCRVNGKKCHQNCLNCH